MTAFRALARTIDDCASRYSHLVVETSRKGSGFALFGGSQARHLFERLYLGAEAPLPWRLVCHRSLAPDTYRAIARRYGLVVFCGDSAPSTLAADLLSVPVLVDMEMPMPTILEGPGAHWTVSAKNNLRRIKRARFEYDVQTADSCLTEFYRRMFRPSMLKRHGAEAYIPRHSELRRMLPSAGTEMLRVMQDGRWVGASLNHSSNEGYRLARLGWLDGRADLLRDGVVSAMYWFNIQRAASLEHSRILFGGVVPYLQDGLLQHKAFWGAHLSAEGRDFGSFRLLLHVEHPDCRRFLTSHSLITRGRDGGYVVFSGGTPATVPVADPVLRSISRWYQWQDRPDWDREAALDELPAPLRPWLCEVPLPR